MAASELRTHLLGRMSRAILIKFILQLSDLLVAHADLHLPASGGSAAFTLKVHCACDQVHSGSRISAKHASNCLYVGVKAGNGDVLYWHAHCKNWLWPEGLDLREAISLLASHQLR
jgi:hypothetical protein